MCSFSDVWNSFDGAASDMTHSVREYGNGSMAEGMRKIVRVAHKSGVCRGRKEGAILGVCGSGIIALTTLGITKAVDYYKKKQKVKCAIAEREKNIKMRLVSVRRKIDDFHATHLHELNAEENKELMGLFAEEIKILKEKNTLQYQKLYSVAA